MAEREYAIPKSLAECADLLYTTREIRLKKQREVEEIEGLESALKEHLISTLPKGQTGVAGKLARVQTENKVIPTVKDWDVLYKYIKKNNAFYLLQRRLTESSVKEIWEAHKMIPGVEPFTTVKVSCTKL